MSNLGNANVDISKLPSVKCGCGSEIWLTAAILKKLSKIQSPNGQEQIISIPVIFCLDCGKTIDESNDQSQPEESKESSIILKG